mmetsp:Transcript_81975/g.220142  ORF Transcript_81975/g.220142 Transcript_81975/m.220142 type:complete len:100 (-) Transcript_81975:260-559(-)
MDEGPRNFLVVQKQQDSQQFSSAAIAEVLQNHLNAIFKTTEVINVSTVPAVDLDGQPINFFVCSIEYLSFTRFPLPTNDLFEGMGLNPSNWMVLDMLDT